MVLKMFSDLQNAAATNSHSVLHQNMYKNSKPQLLGPACLRLFAKETRASFSRINQISTRMLRPTVKLARGQLRLSSEMADMTWLGRPPGVRTWGNHRLHVHHRLQKQRTAYGCNVGIQLQKGSERTIVNGS